MVVRLKVGLCMCVQSTDPAAVGIHPRVREQQLHNLTAYVRDHARVCVRGVHVCERARSLAKSKSAVRK